MARPKGQVLIRQPAIPIPEASGRAWDRAMSQVAEELELHMQEHMATEHPPPSTSPGYPHARTHNLRSGLRVTGTRNGFTIYISGPGSAYARYVNEGTRNMGPRPYTPDARERETGGGGWERWLERAARLARDLTGGSRRRR